VSLFECAPLPGVCPVCYQGFSSPHQAPFSLLWVLIFADSSPWWVLADKGRLRIFLSRRVNLVPNLDGPSQCTRRLASGWAPAPGTDFPNRRARPLSDRDSNLSARVLGNRCSGDQPGSGLRFVRHAATPGGRAAVSNQWLRLSESEMLLIDHPNPPSSLPAWCLGRRSQHRQGCARGQPLTDFSIVFAPFVGRGKRPERIFLVYSA